MLRYMLRLALALFLLSVGACASMNASHSPDAHLQSLKTYYVVHVTEDDHNIDKLIATRLTAMGYTATSGDNATPPQPVDAVVNYVDHWMWDMTMYLLRLNIQIHDGKSGAVIASGESYRPSLQRKSPEVMVDEVLAEMFK
jgi:hypothetical protein